MPLYNQTKQFSVRTILSYMFRDYNQQRDTAVRVVSRALLLSALSMTWVESVSSIAWSRHRAHATVIRSTNAPICGHADKCTGQMCIGTLSSQVSDYGTS